MNAAPVLKFPGAKWRLANWIVAHMPDHSIYCEPFFGSGAVFFSKQAAKVEVLNDLDSRIINLFRVVRERPGELAAAIEMTPWAREEYELSYEVHDENLEDARRFLVRSWQAHGFKSGESSGWRRDLSGRRGSSCVSDWSILPGRILAATRRLKQAHVENKPAVEVISRLQSYPDALLYVDPPYLLEAGSGHYRHSLGPEGHAELLEALREHSGPVLVSGYHHSLYDELLGDWQCVTTQARAEKGRLREEVLWVNPVATEALEGRLF